jgi:hypothetical protein
MILFGAAFLLTDFSRAFLLAPPVDFPEAL